MQPVVGPLGERLVGIEEADRPVDVRLRARREQHLDVGQRRREEVVLQHGCARLVVPGPAGRLGHPAVAHREQRPEGGAEPLQLGGGVVEDIVTGDLGGRGRFVVAPPCLHREDGLDHRIEADQWATDVAVSHDRLEVRLRAGEVITEVAGYAREVAAM